MASVGEILRRERERQGLGLALIAQQTRIKPSFLEALEKDAYNALPGRFFVRSFALQYAEKLGMNTDELLVALQRISGESGPSFGQRTAGGDEPGLGSLFPDRPALDPLPEGTASALNAKKLMHSLAMLVSVVVGCGILFWLWQSQMGTTPAASAKTKSPTPAPGVVSPPAVQPPATTVREEVSAGQPAAPQATPAGAQSTPAATSAAAVPAASPAVSTPTPAPASATPAPPAAPAGKINLVLVASGNVWVRVVADNRVIMEKLMVNGETQVAAANDRLRVHMGSAGSLAIKFNGSDVGPLGSKGEVRTVDFTPSRYQVVGQVMPGAAPAATGYLSRGALQAAAQQR